MDDLEHVNRSRVEWMIVADHADVVNHKLYLMGGGWDAIQTAEAFPIGRPIGIALAIRVPWTETNERHTIEIEIHDEDAKNSLARIEGQFEVGRPPGMPKGHTQRFQMAVNLPLQIEKAGGYTIVARIDGRDDTHTTFSVYHVR